MARMGLVCGALSGAALSLGLYEHLQAEKGVKSPVSSFDWLQGLVRDFEAKFGSTACEGLLGCDISTAEGFRQAKKTQATKTLPGVRLLDLRPLGGSTRTKARDASGQASVWPDRPACS